MKKNNYLFYLLLLCVIIIASCNSDITDAIIPLNNDRVVAINEAKNWYETNKSIETPIMRSLESEVHVTPNWTQAFRRQNEKYTVVEAAFIWEKFIAYATEESYDAYLETKDSRYLISKSRLVIRTDRETKKTDACIMTLIPDKKYFESTDFKLYKNVTYLDKKDFSGQVLYSSLEGEFLEGFAYESGEIVKTIDFFNFSSTLETRCQVTGTVKQLVSCRREPVYITEWREEPYFDSEGELQWRYYPVEILSGYQDVCEYKYIPYSYWDSNCGKSH